MRTSTADSLLPRHRHQAVRPHRRTSSSSPPDPVAARPSAHSCSPRPLLPAAHQVAQTQAGAARGSRILPLPLPLPLLALHHHRPASTAVQPDRAQSPGSKVRRLRCSCRLEAGAAGGPCPSLAGRAEEAGRPCPFRGDRRRRRPFLVEGAEGRAKRRRSWGGRRQSRAAAADAGSREGTSRRLCRNNGSVKHRRRK